MTSIEKENADLKARIDRVGRLLAYWEAEMTVDDDPWVMLRKALKPSQEEWNRWDDETSETGKLF
jgi:hypothetical protein